MTYHFVADAQLIFKVMTFGGGQVQINFSERDSTGTSSFLTNNPNVANAIKNHSFFKKGRIAEAGCIEDEQQEEIICFTPEEDQNDGDDNVTTAEEVQPEPETEEQIDPETSNNESNQLSFANITIAKDYLHRTYGVDKAEIRSMTKIIAFGQSKGLDIRIGEE